MTFALAGSLWAARAQSYGSLLGARVLQGLSMSFFESIVFSVIGDLYFVHERGKRMAIYISSLSAISNLPVLVAGKVDESLGWRWIFWMYSIFIGALWILAIIFGWETAYNRDVVYEVDASSHEVLYMFDMRS
jgi:MFS family permease